MMWTTPVEVHDNASRSCSTRIIKIPKPVPWVRSCPVHSWEKFSWVSIAWACASSPHLLNFKQDPCQNWRQRDPWRKYRLAEVRQEAAGLKEVGIHRVGIVQQPVVNGCGTGHALKSMEVRVICGTTQQPTMVVEDPGTRPALCTYMRIDNIILRFTALL